MKFINCDEKILGWEAEKTINAFSLLEKVSPDYEILIERKEDYDYPDIILAVKDRRYSIHFDSYRKTYSFFNIFKLPAPFDRIQSQSDRILKNYFYVFPDTILRDKPNNVKVPRLSSVKAWLDFLDWERDMLEKEAIPYFKNIYDLALEKVERFRKLFSNQSRDNIFTMEFNSRFFHYSFDFSDPLYIQENLSFDSYKLDKEDYEMFMATVKNVGL